MTQAVTGFNTKIQRGDGGAPENFSDVGEIVGVVKGPSLSRDMKDATNMQSPNAREELVAGILKTGTVDFEVNYIRGNTQQAGLLTDIKNGTLRNFKLVFSDDPTNPVTFAAFVQKADLSTPLDDVRRMSLSLKISGDFAGV